MTLGKATPHQITTKVLDLFFMAVERDGVKMETTIFFPAFFK